MSTMADYVQTYQAIFGPSVTVIASHDTSTQSSLESGSVQASLNSFDRPTVLIGELSTELQSMLCKRQHSGAGSLVPLQRGPEGQVRAVTSGTMPSAVNGPGGGAVVTEYLGSDIRLATYYSILENALSCVQKGVAYEAMMLGSKTEVDMDLLYNALVGGAGSSRSFREHVPEMLRDFRKFAQDAPQSSSCLDRALNLAAERSFSTPLTSLQRQLLSCHMVPPATATRQGAEHVDLRGSGQASDDPIADKGPVSSTPVKVAFFGLGAMGSRMSKVLLKHQVDLIGYDVWEEARLAFKNEGGIVATSPAKCTEGAQVMVLMVVNATQAEKVLFSPDVLAGLLPNAHILLMSTVPPTQAVALSGRLREYRSDIRLIDCPVSGGTPRAATGDLMILAGGLDPSSAGMTHALRILQILSGSQGNTSNLVRVPGGVGKGSAVKLVNQHLAGTHISCVMEYLALATRLGLPGRIAHRLFLSGPAWSWMMGHRGNNMLNGLIRPPTSAVGIFVKDMSIVVREANALGVSVPIASMVEQQFIYGNACGWGADDDSSLVRLWTACGVDVRCSAE